MNVTFKGSETGFEMRVAVKWRSMLAFIRNLVVILTVLASFLATPAGQAVLKMLIGH